MKQPLFFSALLCGFPLFVVGCAGNTVGTDIAPEGVRFMLSEEPSGAICVEEARETVVNPMPVVLIGRIGAGRDTPWDEGKAAFVLSDPADVSDGDHDHSSAGHDHDNCPFCKAKAGEQPRAIVEFHNEQGQTIPIDARKLLGVSEDQLVVVKGNAQLDELGYVRVAADGIYIRR